MWTAARKVSCSSAAWPAVPPCSSWTLCRWGPRPAQYTCCGMWRRWGSIPITAGPPMRAMRESFWRRLSCWVSARSGSLWMGSSRNRTPNAVTSKIHDRMPVTLDPDAYDLRLDPGMRDAAAASELLKPYDARLMRCYPVSNRINHAANDDEGCSAPVELAQIQNRLFS